MALSESLARIPGLAGYYGTRELQDQNLSQQLQQAAQIMQLQKVVQDQEMNRQLMAGIHTEGLTPDKKRELGLKLALAGHSSGAPLMALADKEEANLKDKESLSGMKSTQKVIQPDIQENQQSQDQGTPPVNPVITTQQSPTGVSDELLNSPHVRVQARALNNAINSGAPGYTSATAQKAIEGLAARHSAQEDMLQRMREAQANRPEPSPSIHVVPNKASSTGYSYQDMRNPGINLSEAPAPASGVNPENVESAAKAISEYKLAPLTGFALRSPGAQAIMAKVMELNPSYDAKNFHTAQQTLNAFSRGPQGNSVRAFNVALEHLDTLKDLTSALGNNDLKRLNQLSQRFAEETGRPAPTNFDAAKQIIGEEIIKAVVTGGGGVTERQAAAERLSRANSPQQLQGVIDTYQSLLVGQLKGLKKQYEAGTFGREDFEPRFLTQRSRDLFNKKQENVSTPITATGPNGQKLILKDGQWVPM